MKLTQRAPSIVQAFAVVLSLALPLMLAVSSADARIGGGVSSGSRGARSFSAPPSTSTAPGAAQPFNRTITQPGSPKINTPTNNKFFNQPNNILNTNFLGTSLLNMLFNSEMFSKLGRLSSIFNLILQIGLIVIIIQMAMS